jgi:hypothetical protein
MSKKPETDFKAMLQTTKVERKPSETNQEVTIKLSNYCLDVQRVRLGRVVSNKSVLKPLSTTFLPGKLNVIMFVQPYSD